MAFNLKKFLKYQVAPALAAVLVAAMPFKAAHARDSFFGVDGIKVGGPTLAVADTTNGYKAWTINGVGQRVRGFTLDLNKTGLIERATEVLPQGRAVFTHGTGDNAYITLYPTRHLSAQAAQDMEAEFKTDIVKAKKNIEIGAGAGAFQTSHYDFTRHVVYAENPLVRNVKATVTAESIPLPPPTAPQPPSGYSAKPSVKQIVLSQDLLKQYGIIKTTVAAQGATIAVQAGEISAEAAQIVTLTNGLNTADAKIATLEAQAPALTSAVAEFNKVNQEGFWARLGWLFHGNRPHEVKTAEVTYSHVNLAYVATAPTDTASLTAPYQNQEIVAMIAPAMASSVTLQDAFRAANVALTGWESNRDQASMAAVGTSFAQLHDAVLADPTSNPDLAFKAASLAYMTRLDNPELRGVIKSPQELFAILDVSKIRDAAIRSVAAKFVNMVLAA